MVTTLERPTAQMTMAEPVAAQPAVPALLIERLTKRFEVGSRRKRKTVVAVNDVSLRIERGEIYGVLGANG